MSISQAITRQGTLQGIPQSGYTVFKGIPYAKPPIGELRFQALQPPESWDGVRMADKFSAKSLQRQPDGFSMYDKEYYGNSDFLPAMSEDSLYLNIWTPAADPDEKLPVAFWIHDGAFMGGYGSEMEFGGESYCQRRVILVTINYRLNILGFLAHPWLTAENECGVSGNYGIMQSCGGYDTGLNHDRTAADPYVQTLN